jgi:DNA-directed RNA polymerase specialized sigma subunit
MRKHIAAMYSTGEWTMKELAKQFGITQPRICQIVKEENDPQ